jgi:hypothetical protein
MTDPFMNLFRAHLRAQTLGQRIERVCRLLGYRIRFVVTRSGSPREACGVCGEVRPPFAMVVTGAAVHHICDGCTASSDDLTVTVVELLRAPGDRRVLQ